MPVYEYQCSSCANHFELRRKFSDEPVRECPECGGEVTKLISNTAFTLKGGGGMRRVTATRRADRRPPARAAAAAPVARRLQPSSRVEASSII